MTTVAARCWILQTNFTLTLMPFCFVFLSVYNVRQQQVINITFTQQSAISSWSERALEQL